MALLFTYTAYQATRHDHDTDECIFEDPAALINTLSDAEEALKEARVHFVNLSHKIKSYEDSLLSPGDDAIRVIHSNDDDTKEGGELDKEINDMITRSIDDGVRSQGNLPWLIIGIPTIARPVSIYVLQISIHIIHSYTLSEW